MAINSVSHNLLPVTLDVKAKKSGTSQQTPQADAKSPAVPSVVNYSPELASDFDASRAQSSTQYDRISGNNSNAIFAYKRVLHMDKADELKQLLGVDIYA